MSNILAVIGATGTQGGSVIKHVLHDAELSQQYSIRAITRDTESNKATTLKHQGVEVVQGNIFDRESLRRALVGAQTVFLNTNPDFGPSPVQTEFESAKNVADISVELGVEYLIFSTLPCVSEISGGKFINAAMFDAKAKAEAYIRRLPIKSAFISLGSFMENYITVAAPRRASDGKTFVMSLPISGNTTIPLIDAGGDTGKFTGSILASPEQYDGKTLCVADRLYSLEEIAAIFSQVTGETVVYNEVSLDDFMSYVPVGGDSLAELLRYYKEFGYYGENTKEFVATTSHDARGELTTLHKFLEQHQVQLN